MRSAIIISTLLVAGGLAYALWPSPTTNGGVTITGQTGAALAEVTLPQALSQNAEIGKTAFEAKCVVCHGINAAGQDGVAPPLVHVIYEPNHHGDESFQVAAAIGVRRHHWPFGDMPAVEGVTRGDVTMIVTYIRELQRANGIE